ncbi:UdgX family uracil-DNA binding protein [Devosia sp.]|uniref:UdgX family uracil-DNA binding protein n=1 Tax=Devosia sp. TaxID=1871048 RepID=UPI003BAB5E99
MRSIHLSSLNDFAEWRAAARGLLLEAMAPEDVVWVEPNGAGDLFGAEESPVLVTGRKVGTVPEKFLELGEAAICHSDPERFALLYRLLWRLMKDRTLLQARSDPDVGRLDRLVSAVRRDAHKMTAFVRFKSIVDDSGLERFAAWFEPEHYVLERVTPFFVRRFTGMMWAIITPYRSAYWNGETVEFGPGGEKADVPAEDAMEPVWRSYFASIFNPARLKVAMMKSEMPVKYWRNLPEAELIPSLIRGAREAEEAMIERQASIPPSRHLRKMERLAPAVSGEEIGTVDAARQAIDGCKRCALYENATQPVFGEGPETAEVMFVGEQPGDQEDLAGKPFVGPAGQVFDAALRLVGIERERVYVTNAVKHFKFVPRGRKRLHQRPNAGEVQACKFWLGLEREFIKPELVVAMGAMAVSSLMGSRVTLGLARSKLTVLADGARIFATVHPSYLLRIPDRQLAAAEQERFEDDLREVKRLMEEMK